MTPEQYDLVQAAFLQLREVKLEERENALESLDESIRQEVVSLLDADRSCGSFLQPPDIEQRLAGDDTHASKPTDWSSVGPYRLLQQIGEGGFGSVYMAEQIEPVHRKVALKLIKPGMDSKQVLARFQAERQALAMMEHSSIARFFDVGTTENGSPYFVMELVRGIPIDAFCDENELPLNERLRLFLQVCEAVHHAHRKGIIHRDIKPSNILVGLGEGEPVAKVIDFGIAKALDARLTDATLFTEFGQMVGTLEYMSPEQAQMSVIDIDTRSDVYSLGVLLYRLLTGVTPINKTELLKEGPFEIPRVIRETEPVRPSTRITQQQNHSAEVRRAGVSGLKQSDLDWITMKCLAKDRRERYDSANDLAKDISYFLEAKPVSAHPPSMAYRLRKFARRNRVAAGVTLAIACSALLGIAGLAVGFREANIARRAADRNAQQLAEAMYSDMINSAWTATREHNTARASDLLEKCAPELRGWEWHFVRGRANEPGQGLLRDAGKSGVSAIDLDHSGNLMACTLANGNLEVRDRKRNQLIHQIELDNGITAATFSDSLLVVGTSKGAIVWFDTSDWKEKRRHQSGFAGIYDITFDSSGEKFAICTGAARLGIYNANGELAEEWELPVRCSQVLFSGDDSELIASGLDGRLFRAVVGGEVSSELVATSSLNGLATASDEQIYLLSQGKVLLVEEGSDVRRLSSQQLATCIATDESGTTIIGGGDGTVTILDSPDTPVAELGSSVIAATWDPTNEVFLVGVSDGRVVALTNSAPLKAEDPQSNISKLTKHLGRLTLNNAGLLRSLSMSGEAQFEVQLGQSGIWNAALSPDESMIATVGEARSLRCCKIPGGELVLESPFSWGVRDVCFGHDGDWIAAAPPADSEKTSEGTIGIWDVATAQCRELLNGHSNWVLRLGLSRDGKYLVSSSVDRTIRIWNTNTWECEHVCTPELRAAAEHIAFASGSVLVIGHRDGWITTWDLKTGSPGPGWMAFGDAISGLQTTCDDRVLATCRSSDQLRVFHPDGEVLAAMKLGVGHVQSFGASENGRAVVYSGQGAEHIIQLSEH